MPDLAVVQGDVVLGDAVSCEVDFCGGELLAASDFLIDKKNRLGQSGQGDSSASWLEFVDF